MLLVGSHGRHDAECLTGGRRGLKEKADKGKCNMANSADAIRSFEAKGALACRDRSTEIDRFETRGSIGKLLQAGTRYASRSAMPLTSIFPGALRSVMG